MKSIQVTSIGKTLMKKDIQAIQDIKPQVIFAFSNSGNMSKFGLVTKMNKEFPNTVFLGCSTSGEVSADKVTNGAVVLTALHFDDPTAKVLPFSVEIASPNDSYEGGRKLCDQVKSDGLKGMFILTPGLEINASEFVRGLTSVLGAKVPIAGGLAGDGTDFKETRTVLNGNSSSRQVVGFALYGDKAEMHSNYRGGWIPTGAEMQITACEGNIITRIDGMPALDVYRKLLGDEAKKLPDASLNFPFLVLDSQGSEEGIVRTPLAIDKNSSSLILGGTVEKGSWMRLLRTDTGALVKAAGEAARDVTKGITKHQSGLALVVSCVGRKVVMRDETMREIEEVRKLLGETNTVSGFYAYGELSPDHTSNVCRLHNQTLTLTYFHEAA